MCQVVVLKGGEREGKRLDARQMANDDVEGGWWVAGYKG